MTLFLPPGTLCYVNERQGWVWMHDSRPHVRWLHDVELDAWAATVTDGYDPIRAREERSRRLTTTARVSGADGSTRPATASK